MAKKLQVFSTLRGPQGKTPSFTIGTVETLEAGSDATAAITGTDENPVLNLGIPRGASAFTAEQINALDGIFRIVHFTADPTAAYEAFKSAFNVTDSGDDSGGETEKALTGIAATYSGGTVVVGMSVTSLTGLEVVAIYSDGSTETVTDYTLSGEIVEGENTITVTYGGMAAIFTVTGVAYTASEWVDGKFYFELVQGKIDVYASSGYMVANYSTRVSYTGISCTLTPGKSYRLVGLDGVRYGVQTITNAGYEKIQNGTDFNSTQAGNSNSDKLDSGWQVSGYEFVADDEAVCAWVTASYSSGTITPEQAMPVYLEEVA